MSKMVIKFIPAQYVNSNTNQLQDLTGILGKEILSAEEIGSNENSNLSRCTRDSSGPAHSVGTMLVLIDICPV